MTTRVIVIPAAGRGTRLASTSPKVLHRVAGRPMLDYLLDLYREVVDKFLIVTAPEAEDAVRDHCSRRAEQIECFVQAEPTGMLDAILIPRASVRASRPEEIWVTWCDQVAVHPRTVRLLAGVGAEADRPSTTARPLVVLPTVQQEPPYIHLQRDCNGQIVRVLQRREGDPMPAIGESDSGLFRLSFRAYDRLLPKFARRAKADAGTGERNFLPFLPWACQYGEVATFPVQHPTEAVGVNTPEDVDRVEEYLR